MHPRRVSLVVKATAILAASLLASPAVAWLFSSDKPVRSLTAANWDDHLKKHSKTFVKFYTPWCGHCKALAPKFEAAATELKDSGMIFAEIDLDTHKDLVERYSVKGYPTLAYFEDGERKEDFQGEQSKDALVDFVHFIVRPVVTETQEPRSPGKVPNLVLYAPSLTRAFEAVAKANRSDAYFYFVKQASGQPRLAVQHRHEDAIEGSVDPDDKAAITNFFRRHALPFFGLLDAATFSRYDGRGMVWSLFPVNNRRGGVDAVEAEYRPMMMKVAKRFAEQFSVIYTDTEFYAERIHTMLGVKRFPAIVLQREAGAKTRYVYSGNMTEDAIIQFLDSAWKGEVEPTMKSDPPPASNDAAVRVIVGSTLSEEVFRSDRDVLLKLYAPWCGACKALEPEYKKLAQYVRQWELGDHVTIAKLDATANDVPDSLSYEFFPTLYFIPAGSSTPKKFDGVERTSKGMWQWIKRHTTKEQEIKETQARVRAKKKEKEL